MLTLCNRGRHLLMQTIDERNKYTYYYVLFKHTDMHSFNNIFADFIKENPEYAGHGESINVEWLEYAKNRDATLIYIYPNQSIYSIPSQLAYKFCNKHSLVHEQDRENTYTLSDHTEIRREKQYIFPIKLLTRIN